MHPLSKLLSPLLFVMIIFILGCGITSFPNISARDGKIGVDLADDGFLRAETSSIAPDVEIIYFQYYLDAPENLDVAIDYKWYYDGELIYSYSEIHNKGPVTATLRVNHQILDELSVGNYHVEAWFINTLLITKAFKVDY